MVPDGKLDREPIHPIAMEHERELLKHEAESLRTFYSLTGPARKDYIEQMGEAEANRVRSLRQAQAEGLLAMRRAEAEGYRLIGDALASLSNAEQVLEVARMHTAQRVAELLGEGQATKLFLPHDLQNVFSFLSAAREAAPQVSAQPGEPAEAGADRSDMPTG